MTVLVAGGRGEVGRRVVAALGDVVDVRAHRLGHDRVPDDARLLLDVSSAAPDVRIPALRALLAASVPVVTSSVHPAVLAWAREEGDALARASGTVVVAGVGLTGLIGGWLAPLAAARTSPVEEVHVTYALPDRGALGRVLTPGLRADLPALVAGGGYVLERGSGQLETVAARRRLAWFPRPIGPAHAATLPAAEPVTLPDLLPGLHTAHAYLVVSGWRAELLQAVANASRSRWFAGRVARRLTRPRAVSGAGAQDRWACVAEADGGAGVVRAWAYGRDPLGTAAVATAVVVEHLAVGATEVAAAGRSGHLAPAVAVEPRTALDAIAARTDLRWSVTEPGPAPGRPHV